MNNLPNWIENRYLKLYEIFKNNPFTFKQAMEILSKYYGDEEEQVKVIMSEINQAGLLRISQNPEDKREKIYTLKPLIEKNTNNILHKEQLINLLKQSAGIIRTRVDYTIILLLLFYKAYSDKWEKEFEEIKEKLIEKGWIEAEAVKEAEAPPYHIFNFPKEYLWNNIRKDPQRITEKFSMAMKKLSELNPDYQNMFSQFDFHQFIGNPENTVILNQLIELFSRFSFSDIKGDILGDAYEWILKYFAPTKAKEGEVYTPREVIRLMVEILDPEPMSFIYDPAVGSGGMLIVTYKYVEEKYGKEKADTLFLYGQEVNDRTLALAKMNMLLHDIKNFVLIQGDTLLFPKYKEGDSVKKFDYVIANPPWNQDGYDEDTLKKGEYCQERYKYGFATKQFADWIWIQHMLASAKGKVAVVIDTGAVSRGGMEKSIRQKIVESDLIESVILLPKKLFYNTSAPAVIIILNKNKPQERKERILLINASKEFQAGKKQNTLGTENIKKIVNAYREFKDIEGLSKIITLKDAAETDYNLSPSRFVMAIEEEKYRPIEEIKEEIKKLEQEKIKIEGKINKILENF